ncbi:MAG TPA: hypothetical protein GX511_05350 [Firmicutes bacterium]|nr:hypothetical protein [Bacillota bacterium]
MDFSQTRNLILASVILVIGIGGAELHIGNFNVSGMPLATLIGMVLNLILPTAEEAAGPAPAGEPEDRAQAAHPGSPAKAAAGGR